MFLPGEEVFQCQVLQEWHSEVWSIALQPGHVFCFYSFCVADKQDTHTPLASEDGI